MKSSCAGSIASTMRASTRGSCRKCWPNLLRGRCKLYRELHRLDEAAGVGLAGAGEVEGGAMVDRGPHERETEGHVDAAAEGSVLEHRQALVVVHRQHGVGVLEALRHEQGVGRNRSGGVYAGRLDRRCDDVLVLPAEVAGFSAVRVEPCHEDAGLPDPESRAQVRIDHLERFDDEVARDRSRDFRKRKVRRGEGDAQAAAYEHHHDVVSVGLLCKKLGVPGKGNPSVVDHALLHRRGYHRLVLARKAAGERTLEDREHVTAVARIELARSARSSEGNVLDLRKTGEDGTVADRHQPRGKALGGEPHAKLRADSRRLTGGKRDDRAGGYRSSSRNST